MMHVRVTTAKPFKGEPTWRGEYYFDGGWNIVRNRNGDPLAYASIKAALDGARLTLEREKVA